MVNTAKNKATHTSGIGNDSGALLPMTDKDKLTLDSSVEYYLRNGLAFEPNTMQEYSGIGAFDVMAKIIETATKTDYLTFLKKEIFEPGSRYSTIDIFEIIQTKGKYIYVSDIPNNEWDIVKKALQFNVFAKMN